MHHRHVLIHGAAKHFCVDLGLLRAPLIGVHHGLRIDRLALVNQLLMYAVDSCKGGVEVVIEFD